MSDWILYFRNISRYLKLVRVFNPFVHCTYSVVIAADSQSGNHGDKLLISTCMVTERHKHNMNVCPSF